MPYKKYKRYVKPAVGLTAAGIGLGVASGLTDNSAVKAGLGVASTGVGIAGGLLGAKIAMDAVNDFSSYTKRKTKGMRY